MAMSHPPAFVYHPKLPERTSIDPSAIAVVYDDAMDALFVHFSGHADPAISIDLDSDVYARIDPITSLVVGLQIEYFLARAVHDDPSLLLLAEAANIPAERITEARATIDPAELNAVALHVTFDQLKAMEP